MFKAIVCALLVFTGFASAQYVIEKEEGCVDITVELPSAFTILRLDQTNYNYTEDGCTKEWNATDVIPCSISESGGVFTATAKICDVQSHYFAGFLVNDYMKDNRYAYVSVYFSQGGKWTNIDKNCILPQFSSQPVIEAGTSKKIQVSCARKSECPMGPHTTIMLRDRDLCRDYGEPFEGCTVEDDGEMKTVSAMIEKPETPGVMWAFCSTLDSFLSYKITWA